MGIIKKNNVGRVIIDGDRHSLVRQASDLLDFVVVDRNVMDRCRNLYLELFSPEMAVKQIVYALEGGATEI